MFSGTGDTVEMLIDLQRQFHAAQFDYSRNNGLPHPRSVRTVLPAAEHPTATVELFEGSLRYYPLALEDVLVSDKHRAYYVCHLPSKKTPRVTVRYDGSELHREERLLMLFQDETVPQWNALQIRAGRYFTELAGRDKRRGVRHDVIEAFHNTPLAFEAALEHWLPALTAR